MDTVEAGQPGADDGIRALYSAYWRSMVRLAWLSLHNEAEAEEIAQDAFVAVHRRWADIRDREHASAYLRRCVVNGARSRLRHRGVEERYLASLKARPDAPGRLHVASAEHAAVAGAVRADLLHALVRLPERQREVLLLRYYLDLSEAQIADALGIAPGSVKAHASRGLDGLRRLVDGKDLR